MNILYLLIPLSLILVGLALWLFIWAVRNDQFEDLDGPAHSILYEDDAHRIPPEARPGNSRSGPEPRDQDRPQATPEEAPARRGPDPHG